MAKSKQQPPPNRKRIHNESVSQDNLIKQECENWTDDELESIFDISDPGSSDEEGFPSIVKVEQDAIVKVEQEVMVKVEQDVTETPPSKKIIEKQIHENITPGLKEVPNPLTPFSIFSLFFTTNFLEHAVDQTNSFAEQVFLQSSGRHSRISKWKDTCVEELRIFLGLLFFMSVIKVSRIRSYWSTHYLFNLQFSKYMARDRFMILLRCLYFAESKHFNDLLYKIRPVLIHFNETMRKLYNPEEELSEDVLSIWGKDAITYKGNYDIKLYAITEPNGIVYEVNDNSSGALVEIVNQTSKSVDKNQILSDHPIVHKTLSWYKKLSIYIFHVMMVNSHIIFNKHSDAKKDLDDFQMDIITVLLSKPYNILQAPKPNRIHLPSFVPKSKRTGRSLRKRCRICMARLNKRVDCVYICPDCPEKPGLCLNPCFRIAHYY